MIRVKFIGTSQLLYRKLTILRTYIMNSGLLAYSFNLTAGYLLGYMYNALHGYMVQKISKNRDMRKGKSHPIVAGSKMEWC